MGVESKADFRGWATKAGLKCSDGRTILPNAFQEQDGAQVPLVWQHGHSDPENVLGHAILENRPEGVYAYAFFNDTAKAVHARSLVEHEDITNLSIWANKLIERGGNVIHGAIRELSLVLSGANPGAVIEHVTIRHSDDEDFVLDDEAIIYTGLPLMHSSDSNPIEKDDSMDVIHAEGETDDKEAASGKTVADVFETMNEEQKNVLYFMVEEAIAASKEETLSQSGLELDDENLQVVYDSLDEDQHDLLHFLVSEAASAYETQDTNDSLTHKEGNDTMKHNVFEKDAAPEVNYLSHDDVKGIIADATRSGSLKHAVEGYALAHGIENIDTLFPDATALDSTPQWDARRTEWVGILMGGLRKSPFSRIKTVVADLNFDEARAKGYVKGNLKKEEFFSVSKRTTTPTTIYKKQKLDRDDVVDITDFDVIAWLKAEMRLMLDEELARAILIGDGRDISHDDKISETNIRPIAEDHELYTTTINVNLDDAQSSVQEFIDAIVANRKYYKGTGMPALFTTETQIARFLLLKDTLGRRIYTSLNEIATELRVSAIIPVEVLEDHPEIIGVIVNPADYVVGTDRGGEVNMFDDFDIDYNQMKYLIETRVSGALNRIKSALVIKKVAGTDVLATPVAPSFNTSTGVLSITDTTGVIYTVGDDVVDEDGSPYAAIDAGTSITVNATPDEGYYFATSANDSWTFTRDA